MHSKVIILLFLSNFSIKIRNPPEIKIIEGIVRCLTYIRFASPIFYSLTSHIIFLVVWLQTSFMWEQTGGRILLLASERIAQVVCLRAAPYLPTSPKFPRPSCGRSDILYANSHFSITNVCNCCFFWVLLRDQRQLNVRTVEKVKYKENIVCVKMSQMESLKRRLKITWRFPVHSHSCDREIFDWITLNQIKK